MIAQELGDKSTAFQILAQRAVRTVRLPGLPVALPLATLFIPFTDAAAKSANAIALLLAGSSDPPLLLISNDRLPRISDGSYRAGPQTHGDPLPVDE